VREVASLLATSLPTALKAVEMLLERNILQDRYPQRKRKRIFYAPELLARLERN
jgi:hypothetical protein